MKGGAMPLEGVIFDNLQPELQSNQMDYANKLLAMLKDRSQMKLQTCVQLGAEERELFMAQLKGDKEKVAKALLELQQGRIRQWRRIFAEGGVAQQLMECPEAQQESPQMAFNLMLVPQ
jgi:16S rRNA U516 pseudouridylate synthase RsuA-like enzyme